MGTPCFPALATSVQRGTRLAVLFASLAALAGPPDPAVAQAGPAPVLLRGALLVDSNRGGNYEIYVLGRDGKATALTHDERFDSFWPRASPDRKRILFYRTPAGTNDRDYAKAALWVMAADGSGATLLRAPGADGWALQGHAEWSPDGGRLVMFGGSRQSPQIFLTTAEGTHPVALTHRGGVNLDPSWSPDGRTIVFVGCPRAVCFPHDQEVYLVPASGRGAPRRLTHDELQDQDPVFSPDGRQLAWLTKTSGWPPPLGVWNIRRMWLGRKRPLFVTHDDEVNSKPEWSADGRTLFFHRMDRNDHPMRFQVYAVRPDGKGLRRLSRGRVGSDEYPVPVR